MSRRITLLVVLLPLVLGVFSHTVNAATATIAVATNFRPCWLLLAADFEQQHPHQLRLVTAATGVLFNQIRHGAPFDVLLAADQERPQQLAEQGFGVSNTRFSYAQGQLALISVYHPLEAMNTEAIKALFTQINGKIAIANPKFAPYGLAAQQSLAYLGLWQSIQSQLIFGVSVSQSYQFVISGNAELGLVHLSAVLASPKPSTTLFYWPIPAHWHQPIQQQAILLQSGKNNTAARAFLAYLRSDRAQAIIRQHGYLSPAPTLNEPPHA